jgi:hypothetical protein
VAERVRVREIDDDEGRRLLRIIRRGTGSVVTWRRVADWAAANNVEIAYTPTNSPWLNRIVRHESRLRTAALTEGGSTDVDGVVLGPVRDGPSPPRRAPRVTAGCEARGSRPKDCRSIRWSQAGEDRTGE